ncbi:serine/threonine-protein kinase [Georgenia wangjunii]|uniref:serine/threonine-protein kinase n=1 Tax=Georgenia wangjunii TaxID=3117730 RepID=UPI002F26A590
MRPASGLVLGGRYELRERIAVGGMGEVWSAWDAPLGRMVAAKVLREEFTGSTTFLARLRSEARNAAGLSHPNIAALFDHGEQEGSGYLVMELVHGEPMSALLEREGSVPVEQLVPVLAQVARGLHAAHVGGVVHRDVKPSNILLTGSGLVKITDFGISLGQGQEPITAAGTVMGTAQYLPPEQAMGRPATPAGDIYALGVIAYEALAGRRPYTGSSQVDIAFKHVNEPLPPLPDAVPARVRAVVEQMLAKSPTDRPRSGASLARMLEDALVPAGPVGDGDAEPGSAPAAPSTPTWRPAPASETVPGLRAARALEADAVPMLFAARALSASPAADASASRTAKGRGRGATAAGAPGRGTAGPGGTRSSRAGRSERRWHLPTWRELASDRVWLVTVTVGLVAATILILVALGTLALRDGTPPSGGTAATAGATTDDRLTARDF